MGRSKEPWSSLISFAWFLGRRNITFHRRGLEPFVMVVKDLAVDLFIGRDILHHPGIRVSADKDGVRLQFKEVQSDRLCAVAEVQEIPAGTLTEIGVTILQMHM